MQIKILGEAKKGVSLYKIQILRPLYNRYFCHITIRRWSRICQNFSRKCFFLEIYFLKNNFPLNFLLQLFEHYAKVRDGSKMVSKVIFLDLLTFPMDINTRQQKFWIKKNYAQPTLCWERIGMKDASYVSTLCTIVTPIWSRKAHRRKLWWYITQKAPSKKHRGTPCTTLESV